MHRQVEFSNGIRIRRHRAETLFFFGMDKHDVIAETRVEKISALNSRNRFVRRRKHQIRQHRRKRPALRQTASLRRRKHGQIRLQHLIRRRVESDRPPPSAHHVMRNAVEELLYVEFADEQRTVGKSGAISLQMFNRRLMRDGTVPSERIAIRREDVLEPVAHIRRRAA